MGNLTNSNVVEEVKTQWKLMWKERIDDDVRAEGIAPKDYDRLFVERGTVVLATRNFKLLTLRDILELHKILDAERFVPPDPSVGGWGKFVRSQLPSADSDRRRKRAESFVREMKKPQQLKKGGRGWLHK
jgi:hypothetical protein